MSFMHGLALKEYQIGSSALYMNMSSVQAANESHPPANRWVELVTPPSAVLGAM